MTWRISAGVTGHRQVRNGRFRSLQAGENYTDATASLSLYIRYLREKIEDDPSMPRYIMTKWGIGYWFAEAGAPAENPDNGMVVGG